MRRTCWAKTALNYAEDVDVARVLSEHGAEVEAKGEDGGTLGCSEESPVLSEVRKEQVSKQAKDMMKEQSELGDELRKAVRTVIWSAFERWWRKERM